MKILRVIMVLGLATLEFEANAQFRFPQLPSPPRLIFGGFRPFFSRPRPRPRPPRPPFLLPSNQFFPPQQQPPVSQQFTASRPAPPPPPPQPPSFQQTNDLSFRPPQVITSQNAVINSNGFGSPRPDSIISISQQQSRPQPPPPPPRPQPQSPPPQSLSSTQIFTPTQSSFPPPLVGPNSNNIIGMTPPPPPAPSLPPTQPPTAPPLPPQTTVVIQQPTIIPLVPITARPNRPLVPPISNAVDDLLVNPVPSLNAGILPLANEKPSETQLFPPFT